MWPFKRNVHPAQTEIESHLAHLNSLSLASQDEMKAPAVEAWLESRLSMELAWFARHKIRLSLTEEGQHIVQE